MLLKAKVLDSSEREFLIRAISRMINADDFVPFKTMDHDESHWSIHGGNDWWVTFLNNNTFRITYRYERDSPKEAALANWIVTRWRAISIVSS